MVRKFRIKNYENESPGLERNEEEMKSYAVLYRGIVRSSLGIVNYLVLIFILSNFSKQSSKIILKCG